MVSLEKAADKKWSATINAMRQSEAPAPPYRDSGLIRKNYFFLIRNQTKEWLVNVLFITKGMQEPWFFPCRRHTG